ncbi:MAG: type II secretion system F family protein [Lactobacillales bacterium]|nr:type II secretion system F family protein [Lactobacillales bacterium]
MIFLMNYWKMKTNKLNMADQRKLISLLITMLKNGFCLYDCTLIFKASAYEFERKVGGVLEKEINNGNGLAAVLQYFGYSQKIILQVKFAQTHGNLLSTLKSIDESLVKLEKEKEKFISIITYPCLLLLFLVGILITMRSFLLPELQKRLGYEKNAGLLLMEYGPLVVIFVLLIGISWCLLFKRQLLKKSSLEKAEIFAKLPFIGEFYILQITSYLSREWGRFFEQGMELNNILTVMQSLEKSSLMKDLAKKLENGLQQGISFALQIQQFNFVMEEFSMMIRQAELNFSLGTELIRYGDNCAERLFKKIEEKMQWLQPIVFLFVGGMIVLVYVSMLLPMYQNIGGIAK